MNLAITNHYKFDVFVFSENYYPHYNTKSNMISYIVEILLILTIGASLCTHMSLILLSLYTPHMPPLLGYLIPKEDYTSRVQFFTTLFTTIGLGFQCHGLTLTSSLNVIYNFYIPYILGKELRVGRPSSRYKAANKIRQPQNIRVVFRCFQIVHQNMFCWFGIFLMLINAGCMSSAVYICFVLLRFGTELRLLTKIPLLFAIVMISVTWSGVLEIGKHYHLNGKKVFGSWKRYDWGSKFENRVMAKFRLSCRPILLSYGKTFVVGPASVLNFSKGVVRGTMRCLLSTKH